MPATTTLPVMAGLAILGAAAGVNLGRSAVSEINPAYFSEAEDDFHADLVPYRSADGSQVQSAEYLAAQQPVRVGELGSGCIGCRAYPVEYVPLRDPAVDQALNGYAAGEPAALPAEAAAAEEAADPDRRRIELYAGYPITADSAPAEPAEARAEATDEPTGL